MKKLFFINIIILSLGFLIGCEPERAIYDGEVLITLAADEGDYFVKEENNTYSLSVWLLRPANEDIEITLNVNQEESSAIAGEDFTISEQTVTIPAGELTTDFVISSDFDVATIEGATAKFEFSSEDAEFTQFRNQFTLNILKACPLEKLPGIFDVSSEAFGSFQAEVVTGGAENELVLKDYYTAGSDITVIVNEDFTVTVAKQPAWVSGTYGQASVTSRSGSKIDPCNGVLTLVLEHTVAAGSFGNYTDVLVKQ